MFKNYYYLARCSIELQKSLGGSTIYETYSQERNKLFLNINSHEFPNRNLIISTDQNLPYLLIKDEHHKAKKNTISFWKDYLPTEINNIEIAKNERVIRFTLESGAIYFMVMGGRTNIFFIENNGTINTFKKNKKTDRELDEIQKLEFSPKPEVWLRELSNISQSSFNEFKKEYPQIGRELFEFANEIQNSDTDLSFGDCLVQSAESIFSQNIAVGFQEDYQRYLLMPSNLTYLRPLSDAQIFTSFNSALLNFVSLGFKGKRSSLIKKEIETHLQKQLLTLSKKLNDLRIRVKAGSRYEEYYKIGNLLLANLHQMKKGLPEIELFEIENVEKIFIKLKEKLSPKQNIDYYFEKAKDEKINFKKSKELFTVAEEKYNYFREKQDEFDKAEEFGDLVKLKKELKLEKTNKIKKSMDLNIKLRHFIIDGRYHLFVGRDSRSNDLLSIKYAKQNDYWFHARGLSGSHVVLRVENTKETIPKNILKQAASIAAYYSKGKTAGMVPVAYTFAKYVYKKKGLDPGQVFISKEKVIIVKPEIPSNCVIAED